MLKAIPEFCPTIFTEVEISYDVVPLEVTCLPNVVKVLEPIDFATKVKVKVLLIPDSVFADFVVCAVFKESCATCPDCEESTLKNNEG